MAAPANAGGQAQDRNSLGDTEGFRAELADLAGWRTGCSLGEDSFSSKNFAEHAMKAHTLHQAPVAVEASVNRGRNVFGRFLRAVSEYVAAGRKAKAAEQIYMHMSSLSDSELERHGISRGDIARYIHDRLYK